MYLLFVYWIAGKHRLAPKATIGAGADRQSGNERKPGDVSNERLRNKPKSS